MKIFFKKNLNMKEVEESSNLVCFIEAEMRRITDIICESAFFYFTRLCCLVEIVGSSFFDHLVVRFATYQTTCNRFVTVRMRV